MSEDIVEILREEARFGDIAENVGDDDTAEYSRMCKAAALEIETLRAERSALEAECKKYRDALISISLSDWYTRKVKQHPDGGLRGAAGHLATFVLTGRNGSYLSNENVIEMLGDPRAQP